MQEWVCGALVSSAIKSVTLEYLLISISVNLKTTTMCLIRSDKGNRYIWVIEITFWNGPLAALCAQMQFKWPRHHLSNWTTCAGGNVFVVRDWRMYRCQCNQLLQWGFWIQIGKNSRSGTRASAASLLFKSEEINVQINYKEWEAGMEMQGLNFTKGLRT